MENVTKSARNSSIVATENDKIVLKNGDAKFARQVVDVISSSIAKRFREDEAIMLFGGSHNHKVPNPSRIASDLDIAVFATKPSPKRLDENMLKRFFISMRDAIDDLEKNHNIYAVATFDPNLGATFKYLAKYYIGSKDKLKLNDDKIVLLDCMFYPNLSSAILWPNPILAGMEVFENNVTRILSDSTELLVFGRQEERMKLKQRVELAKPLRKNEAGSKNIDHVIRISEKQIADTYGNFLANIHLPEEMFAIETMNQMKNVMINLVKNMNDGKENWYWKKIMENNNGFPDYIQKFTNKLNVMRNGSMPTHKELTELLDSSVEMINDLVAHIG